jgi:hypothetical protein
MSEDQANAKTDLTITHAMLVENAKEWLIHSKQCNPVFAEKGCARISEIPDAIGWNADGSIVVECKVSKSDLMADAKKPFRVKPAIGMGRLRYMLLPEELYAVTDDHDFRGWGVLTTTTIGQTLLRPRQVRLKRSVEHEYNVLAELNFLRSRILEVQRFGK